MPVRSCRVCKKAFEISGRGRPSQTCGDAECKRHDVNKQHRTRRQARLVETVYPCCADAPGRICQQHQQMKLVRDKVRTAGFANWAESAVEAFNLAETASQRTGHVISYPAGVEPMDYTRQGRNEGYSTWIDSLAGDLDVIARAAAGGPVRLPERSEDPIPVTMDMVNEAAAWWAQIGDMKFKETLSLIKSAKEAEEAELVEWAVA